MNETIYINKNVTIKGTNGKRPIITTTNSLRHTAVIINSSIACSVEINFISFRGAQADVSFLSLLSAANVKIKHCEFTDVNGDVLYIPSINNTVNIQVSHSSIYGSRSALRAILLSDAAIMFDTCTFQEMASTFVISSTTCDSRHKVQFNLINSMYKYNKESSAIKGCVIVNVFNSVFQHNHAIVGGVIKILKNVKAKVSRSQFINNTARTKGGALFLQQARNVVIKNSQFTRNMANRGGAIFSEDSSLRVTNSSFRSNCASVSGGTINHKTPIGNKALFLSRVDIYSFCEKVSPRGSIIFSQSQTRLRNVYLKLELHRKDRTKYIRAINGFHVRFARAWNTTLVCPINFQPIIARVGKNNRLSAFQCKKCEKGTYTITAGQVDVSTNKTSVVIKKKNGICHKCPLGGKCKQVITSRDNYWGFVDHQTNQVSFVSCPTSYCCSKYTNRCRSYDTCNHHRGGFLCGSCSTAYTQSYFTEQCIKTDQCQPKLFWILNVLYCFVYVIFLIYINDAVFACKKVFGKIKERININALHITEGVEASKYTSECATPSHEKESFEMPLISTISKTPSMTKATEYDEISSRTALTLSSIKKIFFFFYQMQLLLHVNTTRNVEHGFLNKLKKLIQDVFNFQLVSLKLSTLCPITSLQPSTKQVTKLSTIYTMFSILITCYALKKALDVYQCKKEKNKIYPSQIYRVEEKAKETEKAKSGNTHLPFQLKIKQCFVQILLLSYTSLAIFTFKMVKCVQIDNTARLFIHADIVCYTWWQYALVVFAWLWIIPFAFSVSLATKMLHDKRLTIGMFYDALLFPPLCFYMFVTQRRMDKNYRVTYSRDKKQERKVLLNIFEGPFKRKATKFKRNINWEVVIIFRKLLLTVLCVFIINPVYRLFTTFPVLITYCAHSIYVKPYFTTSLNRLEVASLFVLLIFNVTDMLWAFTYVMDFTDVPGFEVLTLCISWLEDILLTLPFAAVFVLGFLVVIREIIFYFRIRYRC